MTNQIKKATNSPPLYAGSATGAMASPWRTAGGQQTIVILFGTVGATPTITYKIEGSANGTDWFDVVSIQEGVTAETKAVSYTQATGAAALAFMVTKPWYPWLRLNVTANTNIPITNAWCLSGLEVLPTTFQEITIGQAGVM